MSKLAQRQVVDKCFAVFAIASDLFPKLDFTKVKINFSLRGDNAGQARSYFDEYEMRFNADKCITAFNHIVGDTVPHEIAHIICFMIGEGSSHGSGWRELCKFLGGSGDIEHNLPYVSSSGKTYQYTTLEGTTVRVNERQHIAIQSTDRKFSCEEGTLHNTCYHLIVAISGRTCIPH